MYSETCIKMSSLGRHDIAEILLKVALSTKNLAINHLWDKEELVL